MAILPEFPKHKNQKQKKEDDFILIQKLNTEAIHSGAITEPVCKLVEPSYLYIQVQKGLFLIPKIEDSS